MRLLSESLIIGLLLRFSDFLYDGLKKSLEAEYSPHTTADRKPAVNVLPHIFRQSSEWAGGSDGSSCSLTNSSKTAYSL